MNLLTKLLEALGIYDSKPKKPSRKPKGYALNVGVNVVDPKHYAGWSGPLNACENDARHMSAMLQAKGYETKVLLTKAATRENFFAALGDITAVALPGDIVVVSNSSHGSQVPDYDGDEADCMDETICLYDGQVLDDELEAAWSMFAPGVRLMFISDSCHSGTMARLMGAQSAVIVQPGSKAAPPEVAAATAIRNEAMYRAIQNNPVVRERDVIKAHLLAFGGCQDNQTAMDGQLNGAFTGALLRTLRDYPKASLGAVITRVQQALPPTQTPKYVYGGPRLDSYEKSPAFSI